MITLLHPPFVMPDLPRAWNPDWRAGECIFRLNADIEITMAQPDDYPALYQIDRYFFLEHYPSVGVYRTQRECYA